MLAGELVRLAGYLPEDTPVCLHVEQLIRLQAEEWNGGASGYFEGDFEVERAETIAGYEGERPAVFLVLSAGERL
ncbi:MAG: hypothetical protein HFJ80_04295 [Clostridiales bacterium]|nr:hypothetical protein [Clostridiales bacterium]